MDRRVLAAILAALVIAAAFFQAWSWPQAFKGYGDSISAAGLGLTLIGLGLTYVEIRDARKEAHRAVSRVSGRLLLMRSRHNPHLLAGESDDFRGWESDLRILRRYIEKNRLNVNSGQLHLPDANRRKLDKIVTGLAQIQGRLQRSALEV